MLINQLQQYPVFQGINLQQASLLTENSFLKEYNRNARIFMHGEEANFVYIIISGWVKLFRATFDGQEAILGLATAGDIIGEANFDRNLHFLSAQSINETKLLKIPNATLKQIIQSDGRFALKVISTLNHSIQRMELQIEHAATMNAAQRIGCFIVKLCDNKTEGTINIELPIDKTLIASYLGMKRETFSRGLKELKSKGIIVKGNIIFVPQLSKLIEFSCVSCSLFSTEHFFR